LHRLRPVYLLPIVLAMALVLTPQDMPFESAEIAFIGDSVTLGAAASSLSNDFASLVTRAIQGRDPDDKASLFISVDPNTDLGIASRAMKHDRNVVIIELGVHAAIDQQLSYDDFRTTYGSLLDCVTGGNTIVVAGTVPWLGFAAVTPTYQRAGDLSQIIIEEAAKRDVAVADIWTATKLQLSLISTPQDKTFVGAGVGDNIHPNNAGHAVIAQVYEQAISGELADPPRRPFDRQCH